MANTWLLGVGCTLLAAFCWAVSAIWYKQLTTAFSNLALNFHKGWITLLGLGLLWPFFGDITYGLSDDAVWILLLSGAIGIGIGDTALFAALKRLSEKQTLLIAESVAPIIVVIGGMIFLSEWLSIWQLFAITLIIFAVDLVIGLKGNLKNKEQHLLSGTALALVAALCQASGVILTRSVLSEGEIHPVASTALRTMGGLAFLLLWVRLDIRRFKPQPGIAVNGVLIKPLLFASIIGTLLALSLVQTALGYVNAAIVQTLIATSAIFSTLIAVFKGEKQDIKVWSGMVLAWIGVVIMILM